MNITSIKKKYGLSAQPYHHPFPRGTSGTTSTPAY